MTHPDFALLARSWDLAMHADGYAPNTRTSYGRALAQLADWLGEHHPDVGPADVVRDHIRAWIVHVREVASSGTARSWFPGVRHFFRWALAENEVAVDPTAGVKTPAPNEAHTPLLSVDDIKALLADCSGRTFLDIRDRAIIELFVDGGVRLSELGTLAVTDLDLETRVVFVVGKGSNRTGPRRRAVPIGVRCGKALDRYLRERRHHPYAHLPTLWLGDRGRAKISTDGIDAMLRRRAERVGIKVHPHLFRHTWADAFRAAGGSEGDLMTLGGWRSRQMLDRYGRAGAANRARESYQRLSFGDRL